VTFEPEQLGQSGQELASKLRELRKQAGLSGVRLAARCNMSQSKVSRIENGKVRPSLVDVEQILRALDAPAGMVDEIPVRDRELLRLGATVVVTAGSAVAVSLLGVSPSGTTQPGTGAVSGGVRPVTR